MPIKKDARKISNNDGNIIGLDDTETKIIDEALGITKSKEQLLEEIDQLQEEILKIKSKICLEDEIATTEEVNEGVVEDTSSEEVVEE